MKQLRVTNSYKKILVDDQDYERCKLHNWYLATPHGPIQTKTNGYSLSLAPYIMENLGQMFDHKDRSIYNNQRENLRPCTYSQNMANRGKWKNTSSIYRGVCWHEDRQKWVASIAFNKKNLYLGIFKSEEAAARVYDRKARELHGEFARLNFPQEGERGIK